jgi:predicted nucleic acid binding AN1-type Zn finger protein
MSVKFDMNALIQALAASDAPVQAVSKPVVEEKVRPKRCQMLSCKSKIMLSDQACKCTGFYCSQHRHSETHACTFDYKGDGKNTLEKQLVKVESNKLDRL